MIGFLIFLGIVAALVFYARAQRPPADERRAKLWLAQHYKFRAPGQVQAFLDGWDLQAAARVLPAPACDSSDADAVVRYWLTRTAFEIGYNSRAAWLRTYAR